MADTRCANPEYQLDVDIMMVEYSVYHAIDTKLNALKAELESDDEDAYRLSNLAEKAIENFDILLRLFRHHHPTASQNAGTTFNIKILEFLVLLSQWRDKQLASTQLLKERQFHTLYHRRWLDSWAAEPQGPGRDIKPLIDSRLFPTRRSPTVELNDLLVRFMALSGEIADAMGSVNEQWYKLAAEFMLHSGVERIQDLIDSDSLHDTTGANANTQPHAVATYISECFAWGVVHPDPTTSYTRDHTDKWLNDRLSDQSSIRDMFRPRAELDNINNDKNDTDDDGDANMTDHPPVAKPATEDPAWTTLRTKLHTLVCHMSDTCKNTPTCRCARFLGGIRKTYDLDKFLVELRGFIYSVWLVNMHSLSGEPVLVQIEQGGLEGVDEVEFDAFLERVGLRRGADGGVKWNVVRDRNGV